MTTKNADGSLMRGKWTKLGNGSFGAELRVGGRGAELIGQQVVLVSKANKSEIVWLASVDHDYGNSDVCTFAISRTPI